jgi:hypothetical protein
LFYPAAKTLLKLGGIYQHEYSPKGIMRGNAMLQRQETSQPHFLTLGIQSNVFPAFRTGNHSTDSHDQNLDQVVLYFIFASRIVYFGKGVDKVVEQGDSSNYSGMVTLR